MQWKALAPVSRGKMINTLEQNRLADFCSNHMFSLPKGKPKGFGSFFVVVADLRKVSQAVSFGFQISPGAGFHPLERPPVSSRFLLKESSGFRSMSSEVLNGSW